MKQINSIRYLDYFFLTRPVLFYPGWSTLLAGFLVANGLNNFVFDIFEKGYRLNFFPLLVICSMFSFAAAMGGSFILNQLQDIDSDKRNKKLFLLDENMVPKNHAALESFVLFFLSIIFAFLINVQSLLLILLFILVTGYLYNYQPFVCKNKPLLGLLVNAIMGWIAFALGWVITKDISIDFLQKSMPYLFLNIGLYLLTTVPDVTGDKVATKITFSVKYGTKVTINISIFCYLLAATASVCLQDYFMIAFFVVSAFWIVNLALMPTRELVIKTTKMSLFIFSILICIYYPVYLIMIMSIYFFTKYYYHNRFNFDYPHFRGE